MKRIFKFLRTTYIRKTNPVRWARELGVTVGQHTEISPETHFSDEPYLISIGSHVQVTRAVTFHTHGGGNVLRRKYPDFDCFGKVIVEDWVYLGAECKIMPGVTIGEGSLVAAGSVVTKSVPPGSVVAGNPARYICSVDEYAERNMKYNLNTKKLGREEKRSVLLSIEDEKFIRKTSILN